MTKSQIKTTQKSNSINFFDTKNTRSIVKYFQSVEFKFRKMDNFGLSLDDAGELYKGKSIFLRDLFVPPHLSDRYLEPEQIINAEWQSTPNWQSIVDVIKQNPRCFILGDPGAGKTTLTHWLMLAFSYSDTNLTKIELGELVPFALILRELPLQNINSFDDLWHVFEECNHDVMQAFKQYPETNDVVKTLFNSGQALILLDGLDEITNTEIRQNLVSAVKQGMQDYPDCKFLISSRVVGFDHRQWHSIEPIELLNIDKYYADAELLSIDTDILDNISKYNQELESDFRGQLRRTDAILPVYYLAPFTYKQAEQFVSNWYKQYQPHLGGNHEKRVSELLTRVQQNDGLGRLSRTPVLLNMICFIHARRGRLPDGRAELYQRIAETYLVGLDNARGIKPDGRYLHRFDYADRSDWLSEIAYNMQSNRSGEDEENAILISESRVREILSNKLLSLSVNETDIHDEINFLLIQFAQRSGLFLPRGKDQKNNEERFGFSHLSFLEYFAAKAIKPKLDLEELSWEHLISKTNLSWWHETFVLFFEQIEHFGLAEKYLDKLFPSDLAYSEDEDNKQLLLAAIVMDSGVKLRVSTRQQRIVSLWSSYVESHVESYFNTRLFLQLWQTEYQAREIGYKALKKVDRLDLSFEETIDLSWTSELSQLKHLSIDISQMSDFSELTELTELRSLSLSNHQKVDSEVLARLPKLTTLSLYNCKVIDFSALENLTQLTSLTLGGCNVEDISELAGLTKLKSLSLHDNPLKDINMLKRFTHLDRLNISSCGIRDISPLAALTKLESLTLDDNQIRNVSPLKKLALLELLSLDYNQITDISSLTKMSRLNTLFLSHNQITDVSPLSGLSKLNTLMLISNQITDVSSLARLTNLYHLALNRNRISDVSSLARLTNLRLLTLKNNPINDLSSLEVLDNLNMDGI